MQSHILQIVWDAEELTAEVYTYDKQPIATLSLGEGRQRFINIEIENHGSDPLSNDFDNARVSVSDEIAMLRQTVSALRYHLKRRQRIEEEEEEEEEVPKQPTKRVKRPTKKPKRRRG